MAEENKDVTFSENRDEEVMAAAPDGIKGFFYRAGWIFASPGRVFADIERGTVAWWQPFIWSALIAMVSAYLSKPVTLAVTRLNPHNLPEETLQNTLDKMDQFSLVGVIATPVIILIVTLVVSMIGYILVSILASGSSYKKFFTLFLYSSIVAGVSGLLSVTMVRFVRGVEAIHYPEDATISFGLGFLAGGDSNAFLQAFLKSLDLFSIWSLVIIAMGLTAIFKMKRPQAIICVIPLWLIGVVMLVIGAMFGNF